MRRLPNEFEQLLAAVIAGATVLLLSYFWGVYGIYGALGLFVLYQIYYRIKHGEWEPTIEEEQRRREDAIQQRTANQLLNRRRGLDEHGRPLKRDEPHA